MGSEETLTSAKKDADKSFGATPVGSPAASCPRITLVELVEVVTLGSLGYVDGAAGTSTKLAKVATRSDTKDGAYQQFVNLDKDLEGADKRHPEFGRWFELRARVEWQDKGKTDSLAGKKVFFEMTVAGAPHRPARLSGAPQEGFGSGGGGWKLTSSTDAEGWTPSIRVFVSQYGGDKIKVSAQADCEATGKPTGAKLETKQYVTWRRFWYQTTKPKAMAVAAPAASITAYDKVAAEMKAAETVEYEEADAPARTFYPSWMVGGKNGDAKEAVIGGHNREEYWKKFKEVKEQPVKGHLILCHQQWDPYGTTDLLSYDLEKNPSDEITVDLKAWNAGILRPALKGDVLASGTWKSLAPAGDPAAGKNGNLSDGDILIEKGRSARNAIKIKLPAAAPDPTKHKVQVKLKLNYGKYYGGESSIHQMLIVYDGDLKAYHQTVSHEFGHGFNNVPKAGKQTSPLENHAKQYTDEHGGTGSHCNDDATLDMTDANFPKGIYRNGTCIMFHQLYPEGCKQLFCSTCEPHVRLRDMSKLIRMD